MVERVGVFWDLEICQPSSTLTACKVANDIRAIAIQYGSVTTFKAYADEALEGPRAKALQVPLRASGVTMVHCPHFSMREVVDMTLAVDMMTFAFDFQTPTTVVVITHRDFTYALSMLRMRGHRVVATMPSESMPLHLMDNVDVVLSWEDVLERPESVLHPQLTTEDTPSERPESEAYSGSDVDASVQATVLCRTESVTSAGLEGGQVPVDLCKPSLSYENVLVQEPQVVSLKPSLEPDLAWPAGLSFKDAGVEEWPITEDSSGNSSWYATAEESFPVSSPNSPAPTHSAHVPDPAEQNLDGRFSILVECFRDARERDGTTKIRLEELGVTLAKHKPHVYNLAGVRKFKGYIDLARSEGIIVSPNDDEWVEIHPSFYREEGGQKTDTVNSSSIPPSQSLQGTHPISVSDNLPQSSSDQGSNQGFCDIFNALYWLLLDLSPFSGPVRLGILGSFIKERDPGLYNRVGFLRLLPYLEAASAVGIVELSGTEGRQGIEWVQWVGPHLFDSQL